LKTNVFERKRNISSSPTSQKFSKPAASTATQECVNNPSEDTMVTYESASNDDLSGLMKLDLEPHNDDSPTPNTKRKLSDLCNDPEDDNNSTNKSRGRGSGRGRGKGKGRKGARK